MRQGARAVRYENGVRCERLGNADSSLSEGALRDTGEADWQRTIEDIRRLKNCRGTERLCRTPQDCKS